VGICKAPDLLFHFWNIIQNIAELLSPGGCQLFPVVDLMDYKNCTAILWVWLALSTSQRMTHGLNNVSTSHAFWHYFHMASETLKNITSDYLNTCNQIVATVSGASQVFFPRTCINLPFVTPQSDG
jgi:hypothetical protein